MPPSDLAVIGLLELVTLPDWGIADLPAKVDTGTRTSALHVEGLTLKGSGHVRFTVVLDDKLGGQRREIEAPLVRRGWVRTSSGPPRERLFVETALCLGRTVRRVEIGLVNRSELRFRMLLGRSAFERAFVVDVGRSYLLGGVPPG
jgi:hypothetical protein